MNRLIHGSQNTFLALDVLIAPILKNLLQKESLITCEHHNLYINPKNKKFCQGHRKKKTLWIY